LENILDNSKLDNVSFYPEHNLCFFAVTKCLGTSVKAALCKESVRDSHALRYDYIYDHVNSIYITKDYAKTLSATRCLNFSVIRHPFSRIKSLYKHFVLRDPSRIKELHKDLEPCDFDYFVAFLLDNTDLNTCNHHMKSISSFLLDENDVIIPNIVFRFDQEFKLLSNFLQGYGCFLEKANISAISDWDLKKHTKLAVRDKYSQDFETFNFGD